MTDMKTGYKKLVRILLYVIFSVFAAVYILPLIITISNSFMGQRGMIENLGGETIRMPVFPSSGTLAQFRQILIESPIYLNMFWNSAAITAPIFLGTLAVSSMAAYAFTVLKFRFKKPLFFIYVVVMLLPLQVTLMLNYIVADFLGIQNSWLAIILPGIFSPFGVFILRQQMKVMPEYYIETAQMDGTGHLRIFLQITVPLMKSGLAALAILTFIKYRNLIDQAVIFIRDSDRQPIGLCLAAVLFLTFYSKAGFLQKSAYCSICMPESAEQLENGRFSYSIPSESVRFDPITGETVCFDRKACNGCFGKQLLYPDSEHFFAE